ncbi:gamma-aminobutyric acid type B receptor subunit 1-like [Gigantopelta aegis]|uniref:gamma-aminobutyric acid type B receptor subunit 1-like n=1 Tax=Gigantopelta aegis TaxID=1735272 RepID=UPI001B88D3A8|nr:gamma-aminobutyric acid type B receptor subunit 1-like [Gigantopelta aegis]XP_041355044.1 gamma-aminobutyric acid type B receptor subunit 1-like [Gigantopelta aegis]
MCIHRLAFLLFLHGLASLFVLGQGRVKNLHILGLFPFRGAFDAGHGIRPAVELAIEYVNKNSKVLPGYQLNLVVNDTECNSGKVVEILTERFCSTTTLITILGAGCSVVTEVVAETAYLWNLISISYSSSSTTLSDQKQFPGFFRVTVSESQMNYARVAIVNHYKWTRVAVLYHSDSIFTKMINNIKILMDENNIMIKRFLFKKDYRSRLRELKKFDARIIIGGFYMDIGRQVFCEVSIIEIISYCS